MSNGSIMRAKQWAIVGGEVTCTADQCASDVEHGAPVPLCGEHLKIAFAYVLRSAADLSDEAAEAEPTTAAPKGDIPGWVYFIRKDGLIKIGWTTYLKRRFKELKPDEVLLTHAGTPRDERRAHAAFAHLRVRGEWFKPEPDLLAFIADVVRQEAA